VAGGATPAGRRTRSGRGGRPNAGTRRRRSRGGRVAAVRERHRHVRRLRRRRWGRAVRRCCATRRRAGRTRHPDRPPDRRRRPCPHEPRRPVVPGHRPGRRPGDRDRRCVPVPRTVCRRPVPARAATGIRLLARHPPPPGRAARPVADRACRRRRALLRLRPGRFRRRAIPAGVRRSAHTTQWGPAIAALRRPHPPAARCRAPPTQRAAPPGPPEVGDASCGRSVPDVDSSSDAGSGCSGSRRTLDTHPDCCSG